MSEDKKEDPITQRILAMIEDGGSFTPQEVAQAFYKDVKSPGMPPDGWHKYMTAVRQQAIHLARAGRLQITRKGEPPPDADEWKDKPGKAELFSAEPGRP